MKLPIKNLQVKTDFNQQNFVIPFILTLEPNIILFFISILTKFLIAIIQLVRLKSTGSPATLNGRDRPTELRPSVEFPIFTPHSPTFSTHAHQTPLPHHYHLLPLLLQTRNHFSIAFGRKMAIRLPLHARFYVDERPQRPGVLGWQLPPFLSVLSRFQCVGAHALGACHQ